MPVQAQKTEAGKAGLEKFSINLDKSIVRDFRLAAIEKEGPKRGYLTVAIREAFEDYTRKIEASKKGRKAP